MLGVKSDPDNDNFVLLAGCLFFNLLITANVKQNLKRYVTL